MKTKRIAIPACMIAICLCIAFLCIIFTQQKLFDKETNVSISSAEILLPEKNTQAGLEASLSKSYNNIQDLKNDSYAIVLGDVLLSDKSVRYNDHVDLAISDVKIIECYSGNMNPGDIISIEETGVRDDQGDISIDGVPLLKKNMRVLLFLTEPNNVVQGDQMGYGIVGVYQGKFFVDQNDQIYSSSLYSDHAVSLIQWNDGDSIEKFKKEFSFN